MRLLKFIIKAVIVSYSNIILCTSIYGTELKSSYKKAEVVAIVTIIESEVFIDTTFTHIDYVYSKNCECKAIVLKQYKGQKIADTINIHTSGYNCEKRINEEVDYFIFGDFFLRGIYIREFLPYNKKRHKSLLKLQRKNTK